MVTNYNKTLNSRGTGFPKSEIIISEIKEICFFKSPGTFMYEILTTIGAPILYDSSMYCVRFEWGC